MSTSVGGISADTTNLANSEFAYALKEHYLPGLESALRNRTYLLNRLISNGQPFDMEGNKVKMAIRTGRNSGISFVNGRGALPIPGNSSGINPYSTHSSMWGAIGFDTNVINLSKTDRGAFAGALETEMMGLQEDMGLRLNHALHLDKTLRLAEVAGSPSTGVITVDNASLRHSTSGDRTKYLIEGMYLDAVDTNGATIQAGMKVESIDAVNNTVTVSINGVTGHGSTANNNFLVPGIQTGQRNDYNQGVSGLSAALGSTTNTYWNLNRSTAANARWRPVRVNQNAAVSEAGIRKLITTVQKFGADQGGRIEPNTIESAVILTSFEGYDAYAALLTGNKRFVNTLNLQGGFLAIEADGYPMVRDADCPLGIYQFLNLADWNLGSPTGAIRPRVVDEDGQTIRWVPGFNQWLVLLCSELELGCFAPTRSGELYGVTMTALTV